MRNALVFGLISLTLSCALFRAKSAPYPTGVIFPLEEAGRVEFEGKIVGRLAKDESGRLFFSTDKGYLYCMDSTTQKISWEFTSSVPFGCPPALGAERLIVWDQENFVFCLDKEGALRWKTRIVEQISSPVSLDGERAYLGTERGSLLALDQTSGELLWEFETKGIVSAAPVFFDNLIWQGSGDGHLYILNPRGHLRGAIDIGGPVLVAPLVDGHRLYVGSEDNAFLCYDLRSLKRKWMVRLGGRLLASPWADQKRVYFPATNGVLYALKKKAGDILWWWISPSKSRYDLEFDGQNILAVSSSPHLYSLDIKSGKALGQYDAGEEIRSNPVWVEPFLFLSLFDPAAGKGRIVFFRKKVDVKLSSSPVSPQPVGTEVTFTATATGLHRPRFEFFLIKGEEEVVVQAASEGTTWVWFAEEEGNYTIRVGARDEKESREAEITYEITKNDAATAR